MTQIIQYIELGAEILGSLTMLATLLVRIPGLSQYADDVGGFAKKLMKVLSYLPTLGVNPNTKQLEERVKHLEVYQVTKNK